MVYHALYNPHARNGNCEKESRILQIVLDDTFFFKDITTVENYSSYFATIPDEEAILICGGDGTLNRFINEAKPFIGNHHVYYYAAGSGNDFWRDISGGKEPEPICIDPYINNLPQVTVKGKKYYFINGIGYGIDGYCCEKGDEIRAYSDKPITYTSIAVKGLMFHYKPANAVVTVDGKKYHYKKVWLAPTMNGRFYGGGMMPTPNQNRLNEDGLVSAMVMFGSGKLKTLMVFPSIFRGKHIKHSEFVNVHSGQEIEVEFDRPAALQIDGETILNVSKYTVSAAHCKTRRELAYAK